MNKPTEEFLEFIEIFNDYQGYEDFTGNVTSVFNETVQKYKIFDESGSFYFDENVDISFEVAKKFYCPPFKKHFLLNFDPEGLQESPPADLNYHTVIDRFKRFCSHLHTFRVVLFGIEEVKKEGTFPPKKDLFFGRDKIIARIYFTAEGHYREESETEIFHQIDFSRLRSCICGKYFWAFRKDKFTCSPECGNRVRQQKFLTDAERRKEYNAKRLQYYHENKVEMKRRKLKRSK